MGLKYCTQSRVWVTNNVNYLPLVDHIIVLENGRKSECGTYTELLKNGKDFASFLNCYAKRATDEGLCTAGAKI